MKKLLIIVLFTIVEVSLSQQPFWQNANGPFFGDFTEIVFSPAGSIFAGSVTDNEPNRNNRGVFRSTDNGTTWSQLTNGLGTTGINSLAVLNDGRMFAGTTGTKGIYRSTDNGETWLDASKGLTGLSVSSVVRSSSNTVFFTASGKIYRSADAEYNWVRSDSGYAGGSINRLFRKSNDVLFVCRNGLTDSVGVMRSTNGGVYWTPSLKVTNIQAFAEDSAGTLYAGSSESGMYRSTDDGKTWSYVDSVFHSVPISAITIANDGVLVVGTGSNPALGMYRSSDNGVSWTHIPFDATIRSIALHPSKDLYLSTYHLGIFKSTNNGLSWEHVFGGTNPAGAAMLAVDAQGILFTSATKGTGIYVSNNGAGTWNVRSTMFNNTSVADLLYSTKDGTWWASSANSFGLYSSSDHGVSWHIKGFNNALVYCFLELHDGKYIASGDGGIYASTDNGTSWNNISSTILLHFMQSSDEVVFGSNWKGEVFRSFDLGVTWDMVLHGTPTGTSVVLASDKNNTIYASGYADTLMISTNAGTDWQKKLIPVHNPNHVYYTKRLLISSSNVLYACVKGSGFGASYGAVFYSQDNGLTWSNTELDSTLFANDIIIDNQGYLFAATNKGVFKSAQSITAISDTDRKNPFQYALGQNYPNPFNPSTTIKYTLQHSDFIRLSIVNILGQEIALLVNEHMMAGDHEIRWDAHSHTNGPYFIRLTSGNYSETKKMMLIK